MAKKKPVGKHKPKPPLAMATPVVTAFHPVFQIGTPVNFKIQGSNFFGTVTVAITENGNGNITWTPPTTSVTPDNTTLLTLTITPMLIKTNLPGAGEGDLTIAVTSSDGNTGSLPLAVTYTT